MKYEQSDIPSFNLDTKTVYITSHMSADPAELEEGIDYRVAKETLYSIDLLDKIPNSTLNVVINSHGGADNHGMAIYDRLQGCKSKLCIQAYGQLQSVAVWIMQAATRPGDLRLVSKHCEIMIHHGVRPRVGKKTRSDRNYHAYQDKRDMMFTKILLEQINKTRPDMTYDELYYLMKSDYYLTPKQAKEWNLIDDII